MAISWLAVLQSVPWSEVIHNAPKVAEGARKLWKTMGHQAETPPTARAGAPVPTPAELASRLHTLEAAVADLHEQLRASSEVIKDLAEQNTQLIRHAETNRVRTGWLAAGMGVMGVALIGLLVVVLRTHLAV